MNKNRDYVIIFALTILVLFFGIKGVIEASSYLIPLTFALVLALISISLSRKLEHWGLSRGLAALACTFIGILAFLSFFFLLSVQGQNIAEQWPEMKKEIQPKVEDTLDELERKTGLDIRERIPGFGGEESESDQEASTDSGIASSLSGSNLSKMGSSVAPIVMNIFSFFGNSVLIFVYLFFMLSFRANVKQAILLFFDESKRTQVSEVLNQSIQLVLNFLGGRFLLILFLAMIYTAGLTIAGVENAILISLMAALFSLVPYLGVWLGFALAALFTILGGGDTTSLIIVASTYFLAQFIESYILEPFVVGDKVDLNPLMTVLVVVAGGMIWGIPGMILSIPLAGMSKIIFDAIPMLRPIGYLLGGEDTKGSDDPGFLERWGKKIMDKVKRT